MKFNPFNFDATGDYQYLLSTLGHDVLVNDKPTKVLITNTNLNTSYNDKRISSLSPLNRGDFVYYEGKQFMIISEQTGERYNKHKGIMRQLPLTIKVNHDCNFIDVPCYIDSPSFNVINGKILSVASGNIHVHTQSNKETRKIEINDRWIKYGQVFKIIGIDPLSRDGIITFICEKDSINPASDDVSNDLAGWFDCQQEEPEEPEKPNELRIEIKSTFNEPNIIKTGLTKQYYAEVYDGDLLIEDAAVTWKLYADDKTSSTTLAIIIEHTETSCRVKNNDAMSGYVQLRAVLESDETVESWLRVRMRTLI